MKRIGGGKNKILYISSSRNANCNPVVPNYEIICIIKKIYIYISMR